MASISAKRTDRKTLCHMLKQGMRSPTCRRIAPVQVAFAATYSLVPKMFVVFPSTGQPNAGERSMRVCRMSDNLFDWNESGKTDAARETQIADSRQSTVPEKICLQLLSVVAHEH